MKEELIIGITIYIWQGPVFVYTFTIHWNTLVQISVALVNYLFETNMWAISPFFVHCFTPYVYFIVQFNLVSVPIG